MSEISPKRLDDQILADGDDLFVLGIRHEEEDEEWHVPDQPPNFERVKRTNVGQVSVPADERTELELGPSNCAAK